MCPLSALILSNDISEKGIEALFIELSIPKINSDSPKIKVQEPDLSKRNPLDNKVAPNENQQSFVVNSSDRTQKTFFHHFFRNTGENMVSNSDKGGEKVIFPSIIPKPFFFHIFCRIIMQDKKKRLG